MRLKNKPYRVETHLRHGIQKSFYLTRVVRIIGYNGKPPLYYSAPSVNPAETLDACFYFIGGYAQQIGNAKSTKRVINVVCTQTA